MNIPADLQGTVRAPEFPAGAQWLNTDHPFSIQDLKGKIVLLDFWTFCCINCMHVIPDLKKLEAKYPNELVVIGVHSAKFNSEKDSDNIRNAILRYEIHHPVINDENFKVWGDYGVRAWPSFALIDPTGKVVGMTSGEGVYDLLDPYISGLINHYKPEGLLNLTPMTYALEKDKRPETPLSFPGKIAADEKTNTLVISDSDHNRILLTTLNGDVKEVIGGKDAGLKDGDYSSARFFRPQGVYYSPEESLVYVADTENHAIRQINLKTKKVETLAGTGHQARHLGVEGSGTKAVLNSPWDLTKIGDLLYIAMAGAHQIWTLNLKTKEAKVYAGSGYENISDDNQLKKAALAQTSGITTDGRMLYFVDSETSSLRYADLNPAGGVGTFIGTGLFDFGDKDGPATTALLQHPIGVAWHNGLLYIADTYNNKIKYFDPKTLTIKTLLGGSKAGHEDGKPVNTLLNEPCGLAFAGDKLFITDTNNGLIRVYDFKKQELSTLMLTSLEKLNPMVPTEFIGKKVYLESQKVGPSVKQLQLELTFPIGLGLNAQAPSQLEVSSSNPETAKPAAETFPLASSNVYIPLSLQPGQAELTLTLHLYYCSHGKEALCYFKEVQLKIPLVVSAEGASHLTAPFQILN